MSERQEWYRRYKPQPENDIRRLLPKSLVRGQRFETLDDCRAERDQRIEELRKPKYQNERLAEHLADCRDEHYQCELTACPMCMRASCNLAHRRGAACLPTVPAGSLGGDVCCTWRTRCRSVS